MRRARHSFGGMTLVEAVVAVGVLVVAFVGLYNLFRASVRYVQTAQTREGALALAVERMEQMRALSYASVGTVNGIPSGTIPQNETAVLDGVSYNRRTLVEYVDDSADGTGAADQNSITTDYKVAKVIVSWATAQGTSSVSLISNFIPTGIESNVGGGTLYLQAINALGQPVSGATVHIVNSSASVDVTTYANTAGAVAFPGTPVAGGYQITVTAPGYSTAGTYTVTSQNANPSPGNLTVSSGQTTSASFAIDKLASLLVRSWQPIQAATTTDPLDTSSGIASSSSTTVTGGALGLSSGSTSGVAYSTTTSPSYLSSWSALSWDSSLPSGTSAVLHLYQASGNSFTLVPDAYVPGNSSGFTSSPVSLAGIPTSTYPGLTIGAALSTQNASNTPQILDWSLSYNQGPSPVPSIPFTLQGTKTIGTTALGAAIYKVSQSLSTDATSQYSTSTLEWDSYTLSVATTTGYDLASACPSQPVSISPGSSVTDDLYVLPHTQYNLQVFVRGASSGLAIANATTSLSKTGFAATQLADSCGTSFFSGLSNAAYTLSVSAPGYTATTTSVTVTGQTVKTISL